MRFSAVLCFQHGLRSVRSNFPCLLFVMAFFTLVSVPAHAQSASISGQIIDPSGAMVKNVQITLTNDLTHTALRAKTNGVGIYSLPFVAPGKYTLHAEATGFSPYTQTGITVTTAQNLELDFRIKVGGESQSVTVNGSGSGINTTDASVSTVIDRQFVENIPLNGRSFQSLIAATPGVSIVPSQGAGTSGEFSVNGQRTESNYFTVDGVSVNTGASDQGSLGMSAGYSGATPGETALGTTQSLVSLDALQEFRATTSTYSAEYGRSQGGQFSFETRSGTAQWHGSAFDYLRNGALDANDWFSNASGLTRPAEHQNDFGGTFGGPLAFPGSHYRLDHTFFFFSYEGLRLQLPHAAQSYQVPSLSLRENTPGTLQVLQNAFPLPSANEPDPGNGMAWFVGSYSSPGSLDTSSIRIDHDFGDRLHLFGRYSNSSSELQTRGTTNLAELDTHTGAIQTITLGATNAITPRWNNDFRFNFTKNDTHTTTIHDAFGGATPLALSDLPGLNTSSLNWFDFSNVIDNPAHVSFEPMSVDQNSFNIVDNVGTTIGHHFLRFGIDYRRLSTNEAMPPIHEFGYVWDESQLLAGEVAGGNLQLNSVNAKPVYQNFSTYLQDEWKATSRLSLSLGLRWDINPAPGDAGGNVPYTITNTNLATAVLAPKGTALWKTAYGNFAPRIGAAWKLHDRPGAETVLRAGFGIYYDPGNALASLGYNGIGYAGYLGIVGGSYPFTESQIQSVPAASVATPYNNAVMAFDPSLKLPDSRQWNVALEQSFGANQTLTINYVGSTGSRLLMMKEYDPSQLGNLAFSGENGLFLTTNSAASNYNSLQVKYQRQLSHRFQALLSYTWAHAFDDATSNFEVYEQEWGPSDYDIRNNFQGTLTYALPEHFTNRALSTLFSNWAADSRISARSSLPVDILGNLSVDPVTGAQLYFHPNRNTDQPLYLSQSGVPGERVINDAAFTIPTDVNGDPLAQEGNAGRNSARAFANVQTDLAIRRTFPLKDQLNFQFRAEAFNLFNQANFGSIRNQVGVADFGHAYTLQSTQLGGLNALYQVGGPRSLQLALRIQF